MSVPTAASLYRTRPSNTAAQSVPKTDEDKHREDDKRSAGSAKKKKKKKKKPKASGSEYGAPPRTPRTGSAFTPFSDAAANAVAKAVAGIKTPKQKIKIKGQARRSVAFQSPEHRICAADEAPAAGMPSPGAYGTRRARAAVANMGR